MTYGEVCWIGVELELADSDIRPATTCQQASSRQLRFTTGEVYSPRTAVGDSYRGQLSP